MNLIVFEIVKVQKKKKMSCKIFANLNGLLTLIKTKYHSKHSSRQPKKKTKNPAYCRFRHHTEGCRITKHFH